MLNPSLTRMTALVAKDGFYAMKLSESRSKQFGLIVDLSHLSTKSHAINVPFSSEVLKMFDKSEPLMMTKQETTQIVELLYFLQASQGEIDEWIVRFPLWYHDAISETCLRMLWDTSREQTILPQSVLHHNCDNLQVYKEIGELLEELLGVKIPNLLYVAYLVTKRIGKASPLNYMWNLTGTARMGKLIKLKQQDEMFTYDYMTIPDSRIYKGKRELLELVREDERYKLLPESLFTRTPEELGLERAKEMFELYWKKRASLYRDYMGYHYDYNDPDAEDESYDHAVRHAVTEVALPRLLMFWTMLAEAGSVVDIASDDMKMTSVTRYATQLADLLVTETTQCRDAAHFVYTQRDVVERAYLAKHREAHRAPRELTTQYSTTRMLSLVEADGERLLGEANAKFLRHYTNAFSVEFITHNQYD